MPEIRFVYGYKKLQIIQRIGDSSDSYMHALDYRRLRSWKYI